MKLLVTCGALAAGEYLVSFFPQFADAWPIVAVAAVLVALFGHGLAVRGWWIVATFLLGAALFLFASTESEQLYREKPWMRDVRRAPVGVDASSGKWRTAVKGEFARRIALGLDHDRLVVALNRAILLGERKQLPRQTKRAFVDSGTMHVFAISGLHVMAVAQVLVFALSVFCLPIRWTRVMAIPLIWGYVMLIGCTPSAVRAAVMMTFYHAAPLFWRRRDGLRAWELTFLLVHLVNPQMISNVGNAMSFAVMLAIVLADRIGRRIGWIRSLALVTVLTWAASVPIAAHVFGRVTPGGMLANLVLIAGAGYTVVCGVIGVLVSFVSEGIAMHVNNLCALCTHAMVWVAEIVSRLPGASVEVPCWTLLQCAEWYALLALILYLVWLRRRRTLFK